jgi:hypothetical protein
LKTFKTLTGATPDPVPVETMFQGTGSKKGSVEMKEKMAKLRAMRKKKTSGEGLVAEGSGEGITMEMEGTGKAYTKEEWTEKLCEGENSLIEQKKKKIDEREAKKAAKKAEAEAKKAPAKKAPTPPPTPPPSPPPPKKKAPRNRLIKDIVRKRESEGGERLLYVNRFFDYPQAYDIIDGKTMEVGKVKEEDYGMMSFTPYKNPKRVPINYKFYNRDGKLIKSLNDGVMSGEGMSGEGKQTEKDEEDERLAMKISDMAKKVSKIEKEHEKMTGKGKHDAPTIMPVTNMPVAISEPKPRLGQDPATWSPVVSAPRPDFEKGHNVPIRAGRFSGVSGSKLLGRRHQAFSSQPHSSNYSWKTTLGMPR